MSTITKFFIMHVPGFDELRDINVEHLQKVLEPVAPVKVLRDPLKTGILNTYRRGVHGARTESRLMRGNSSEWAIIMQDDAVPAAANWAQELEAALEGSPHPFVSLCHFSDHGLKLAKRGLAYGEHINAVWGQAVAYRADHLERYWNLVDGVYQMDQWRYRKWDDGLSAVYNLMYGTKSAMTSRAIFTHLDVKSTQNHVPGRHRHPACTIADPEFADIPWEPTLTGKISISVDSRVTELAERMTDRVAGSPL